MFSKVKKGAAIVLAMCLLCGSVSLWADPVFPLNPADVNSFDRMAITSYSSTLSKVSTLGAVGMMGMPGVFLVPSVVKGDTGTWLQLGCEYAVTLAGTWGTKELLKTAVARPRPYMYTDNPPADKIAEGEWNRSFPSGHTSVSFAAAGFASYTFNRLYPDSDLRWLVTGAAYGGAATVAAMRVASGSHFITDVAAGAAIGTLWGYGVPLVSRWIDTQIGLNGTGTAACILPAGFAFITAW